MPTLRSRNHFPPTPNGWQFEQAETGWKSTPWIGFNETVAEIINHRKGNSRFNLPTDKAAVESELEDFKVRQISAMPNAQSFLLDAPAYSPPSFPVPRQRQEASAAGGANRAVAGASLLIEWLGDGMKPVSPAHATRRAKICAECPLNQKPDLKQKVMGAVSRAFHLTMEAKNGMNARTPYDNKLETCQACDCPLQLKVHAEMAHIKKYTTTETYEKLHGACWIRSEWNS